MPFLDELAARIVAAGAGTVGVDLFMSTKAQIPVGDGPYTSLVESGGARSRKTQDDKPIQRPSCSIVVRAKSYQTARTRAAAVYAALGGDKGLYNTVLSGVMYLSLVPTNQLFDLGLDDVSRVRIAFNIDAEKYPS